MKFEDMLDRTASWLKGSGPNSDIVISSRIRLARNLEKFPFPHWAKKPDSEQVLALAAAAFEKTPELKDGIFLRLDDFDNVDKQFLVERHLMSNEHAIRSSQKALFINPDENVAIMVNEEDHLRIQVMESGFDLDTTWRIMDSIDNRLSEVLTYAFKKEWGYLTACPTNTGTGMRGSIMLHLPALVMTRQINRVLEAIAKLSFTTRGLYGEGTQASGNFFQISNQVSLGSKEEEILGNIKGVIKQIIEQEEKARESLVAEHREMLEDRIWRSYGTLKNAHIISSNETVELLSMLRLGADLGIVVDVERSLINELFILTQPSHLQKFENKKLSANERDVKRAQIIRERIGG
ncbi:MAG: protein arginine kinase [Candidatus Omnitrophica bacterium CG1_02_44_16]|nr:MAG: protein arginine kinase [Candidatus Omnitrophica bacterium CG1_02_44_16]PIY83494.1 MAG: protein arginine kinase [Candidatus Omnitrophica bacterium CG_4_10_14_0_8_um_filter_44_12]PIZ84281.1 MAG: protein arginine kinase [Candidatus Omnitrophica bacterium CG_4_10_14_0_2_um_filter_44_9]